MGGFDPRAAKALPGRAAGGFQGIAAGFRATLRAAGGTFGARGK